MSTLESKTVKELREMLDKEGLSTKGKKSELIERLSSDDKCCDDEAEVKLTSYSIQMVIPVARYANIQPKITVEAPDPESALKYITPHMNKLWKEYYQADDNRPDITPMNAPEVSSPTEETKDDQHTTEAIKEPKIEAEEVSQPQPEPPASSVAFRKAVQAIEGCKSEDALNYIFERVSISDNLTKEDKINLAPIVDKKYGELKK